MGVGAGVGGIVLSLLLHETQHLVFDYSLDSVLHGESFLHGLMSINPEHRFWGILMAGLVATSGGIYLYHERNTLVSVPTAVKHPLKRMAIGTSLFQVILQIITVAMGSPLGRETAPRQLGALFASVCVQHVARNKRTSSMAFFTKEEMGILIACGAGAGLAAVYDVPLAGALFTLEVLLHRLTFRIVLSSLLTSFIAARVGSLALGTGGQYTFHDAPLPSMFTLTLLALFTSPLIGSAAYFFRHLCHQAKHLAASGHRLAIICMIGFVLVAIISIRFPEIPGNGKGMLQTGLDNQLPLTLACALLFFKSLSVIVMLRGGVEGGVMTPSLAIGGCVGAIIFMVVGWILPVEGFPAYIMAAAAGFLSVSMAMPITTIVLVMELAHLPLPLVFPVTACVAGAYLSARWLAQYGSKMITHRILDN